jgi:hypothetical protein
VSLSSGRNLNMESSTTSSGFCALRCKHRRMTKPLRSRSQTTVSSMST